MTWSIRLTCVLLLMACAPAPITAETGSETGESESGETGEPLGPCWTQTETGFGRVDGVFAWGSVFATYEVLGDLIIGQDGTWLVGEPEGTVQAIWGTSLDELFFVAGDVVSRWDGQTQTPVLDIHDPVAGITISGEIWLAANGSGVFHWTGDSYENTGGPPPTTEDLRAIVPTDDDVRWIIDDDFYLFSQTADGPWIEHGAVPGLTPTLHVRQMNGDGQGGLWLVAYDSHAAVYVHHRDAQGMWTSASYDPAWSPYEVSAAAIVDDGLYLFDWKNRNLHRWDGLAEIELLGTLPDVQFIGGGPDRLFGFADIHGQAAVEIEVGVQDPDTELLWERLGVTWSTTSSASSIGAVYQLDRRSLRRWNEGWTYLADSAAAGDLESGFFGLWAESAEVAWVSEIVDEGTPRTRLWRWEAEQLVAVEHDIDPDVSIEALWGSAADRVFAIGARPDDSGSVWAFDGQAWSELPSPAFGYRPTHLTGSEDRFHVLDAHGQVFAWDAQGWEELPASGDPEMIDQTLVWAGHLFLWRHTSSSRGFTTDMIALVLDGDAWVPIDAKWPDGPSAELHSISSDGVGGLWGNEWSLDDARLVHFDGQAWTFIETEAPIVYLQWRAMAGAPEGVLVLGDAHTQQYRRECP
jgi:hypothetical protein